MGHWSIHVPQSSGGSAFLLPCILKLTHLARVYIDFFWTGALLPSSFYNLQLQKFVSNTCLSGPCNCRDSETYCVDTTEALQICSMAIRMAAIVLEALWAHCKLVSHWLIFNTVLQGLSLILDWILSLAILSFASLPASSKKLLNHSQS